MKKNVIILPIIIFLLSFDENNNVFENFKRKIVYSYRTDKSFYSIKEFLDENCEIVIVDTVYEKKSYKIIYEKKDENILKMDELLEKYGYKNLIIDTFITYKNILKNDDIGLLTLSYSQKGLIKNCKIDYCKFVIGSWIDLVFYKNTNEYKIKRFKIYLGNP